MSIACRCSDAGTLNVMLRRALFAGVVLLAALGAGAQEQLKFMGRDVTVVDQGTDDNDGFPTPRGPASVCLEGTPRQCYTMPEKFGRAPEVEVVQVTRDLPALLFSAATAVVNGFQTHFALLRPGLGEDLEDLFLPVDASLSDRDQHAFWTEPQISGAKVFVTAEDYWDIGNETRDVPHRYIISSYTLAADFGFGDLHYRLGDRYMTVRRYDVDKDDILAAEKQEILARLARVKQQGAGVR